MMASPRIEAVVIGGSAGSLRVLEEILPKLPADFPPVLVVVHLLPSSRSLLPLIFEPRCAMRVREAEPFERVEHGTIYFAPADYHLLVDVKRRCLLTIDPPVHFSRPAIDVLFESAAVAYGDRLAGVVLTGASDDGARGLRLLHEAGGVAMVQEPTTAEVSYMPNAARTAVPNALVLEVTALITELRQLGNVP